MTKEGDQGTKADSECFINLYFCFVHDMIFNMSHAHMCGLFMQFCEAFVANYMSLKKTQKSGSRNILS